MPSGWDKNTGPGNDYTPHVTWRSMMVSVLAFMALVAVVWGVAYYFT